MTDSKTVVEDLAAWLTAVWDEREKACMEAQEAIDTYSATAASGTLELRWMLQLRKDGVFQGGWDMPGPPTPTEDLARIAADRKILAHCLDMASRCSEDDWPDGGMEYAALSDQARYIVKLKAEPYKDRPGFRSEWLVERQGVEG